MARASANVDITVTADEARAIQSWLRLRQTGPQGMDRDLRRLGGTGGRAGRNIATSMTTAESVTRSLRREVVSLGLGFFGLQQTIGLFRREFAEILRLQQLSGAEQVKFGTELALTSTALGAREDVGISALTEAAIAGSTATGVPADVLLRTMRQALGAKGAEFGASQAIAATTTVAGLFPALGKGDPGSFQSLVDATLATMKAFQETDPAKAVGAIEQAFQQSRATDLGIFAKTIIPTISQLRVVSPDKERDTFQNLAAAAIALGQASEDPQSRRTATAFVRLMQTLLLEMKKIGEIGPSEGFTAAREAVIAEGRSEDAERVRQAMVGLLDPAINEIPRMLDKKTREIITDPEIGGELRQRGAMMQFFDPRRETLALRILDETTKKLDGLTDAVKDLVIERREAQRAIPEMAAAEAERAASARATKTAITDPAGAAASIAQQVKDLSIRAGGPFLGEVTLQQAVRGLESRFLGDDQIMAMRRQIGIIEANIESAQISRFGLGAFLADPSFVPGQGPQFSVPFRGDFPERGNQAQREATEELKLLRLDLLQALRELTVTVTVQDENGTPRPATANVPQ